MRKTCTHSLWDIGANLRYLLTVRPEIALTYVLFLLWSGMLIFSPVAKLAGRFRPKFAEDDRAMLKPDASGTVFAALLSCLGSVMVALTVWGTIVSAGVILFKSEMFRGFPLLDGPLSGLATGVAAFVLIFRKIRSFAKLGIVNS